MKCSLRIKLKIIEIRMLILMKIRNQDLFISYIHCMNMASPKQFIKSYTLINMLKQTSISLTPKTRKIKATLLLVAHVYYVVTIAASLDTNKNFLTCYHGKKPTWQNINKN